MVCGAILLLTGCTQLRIDCGVEGNIAFQRIEMEVNLETLSAQDQEEIRWGLEELAWYYRNNLGYEVEDNLGEEGEEISLTMRLERQAEDEEAAFGALRDMVTDESLTPFTLVDAEASWGEYERAYAFRATVNGEKLVGKMRDSLNSQAMEEFLTWGLENSSAQISLTLPATEVAEYTGKVNQEEGTAQVTAEISWEEETELSLVTRASNRELLGEETGEDRLEQLGEKSALLLTGSRWGAVGVIFFFLLLLLALVLGSRRNKG